MKGTFIELCLKGEVELDAIENCVREWHEGKFEVSLAEHIGMSAAEYGIWVERPAALPFILLSRRHNVPLDEALRQQSAGSTGLAARAASAQEAKTVLAWLRRTGRI